MNLIANAIGIALLGQALPDANEATIQASLSTLAESQTVFLQLTGSVTYRGKTTLFTDNLSWMTDFTGAKPIIRLELQEFQGSSLTRRYVGDGENLWGYNLVEHTYSAINYGGYGASRSEFYELNLLNYFSASVTGNGSYLAKLLKQTYNLSKTPYSSWAPGTPCLALPQTILTPDPVNPSAQYLPSATDWFYMYNAAPKRSIVFEVVPQSQGNNSNPIDQLQNIFMNQLENVGRYSRFTHWQITPYSGINFATSTFTPYSGNQIQGWRSVAGPKPANN
jgi:hypothetical protein